MGMFKNMASPAKTFVYLSILSIVLFIFQSMSFMGSTGMLRTLVSKIFIIAVWAFVLNFVCKGGGVNMAAAWILALAPFVPSGLSISI